MTLPNPVSYHIYTGQPLPPASPYAYILARQGVVKAVDTPHFSAAIPVSVGYPVRGLADYPVGIRLHVPRIPATWLKALLAHARGVGPALEQMYHYP